MKIDRIESFALLYAYPVGFTYAGGTCTHRVTSLVRVHTDDGRVGVGSAYSHPGIVQLVVQDQLAPLLEGEDPTRVEQLWERMYRVTRWYGRKGGAVSALGALDTAFWDLRGQAAGQPLWQLLGGDAPRCAAYASALLWKDPEELAAEAAALAGRGFRRMKMRLGRGPQYDRAAVRAVRAAIGESCDLMVDGSMRYDLAGARHLAAELAAQRVFWFEEPFEPENVDDYVSLRGLADVRLAAGENEFGYQGFRELVRAGTVDIVQPDASRCGGISEVRKIARLAQAYGLGLAPHSWSDAVAIVANAHTASASPAGVTVEVDQTGNPFVDALLDPPLPISGGMLALGDAPGLGIRLNEDCLREYRVDPFHLPDGSYSDMVFGKQHLV